MKSIAYKPLTFGMITLLLVSLVGCSMFNTDKGRKSSLTKEEHLRRGKALLNEGKHKDAWIEFKNALQIDPKDPDVHFQLARTYSKMNDFGSAFKELQLTVDFDPA